MADREMMTEVPSRICGRGLTMGWLAMLSGCATVAPTAPSASVRAQDYAPLKIGSAYTYEASYPGQTGELTVTMVQEKDGYVLDDHNGAFRLTQDGLRDRDRFLIRHPLIGGH